MINAFLFFWLIVFAVIGILCTVIGSVGLFAMFFVFLKFEREQKARKQEYEGMRQALFNEIKPK